MHSILYTSVHMNMFSCAPFALPSLTCTPATTAVPRLRRQMIMPAVRPCVLCGHALSHVGQGDMQSYLMRFSGRRDIAIYWAFIYVCTLCTLRIARFECESIHRRRGRALVAQVRFLILATFDLLTYWATRKTLRCSSTLPCSHCPRARCLASQTRAPNAVVTRLCPRMLRYLAK